MSNLTPEVLEELGKALADYKAACAAGNGEKMYRTGNRVEALCWAHFPALLAAAQRVQELEVGLRVALARVRAYESVIRDHDNTATPDVLRGLLDQFKALRAKAAELEGDRERMDWLDSQRRTLGGSQGAPTTETWPTIMGREGARVRDVIDAARLAGTEE